MIYNEDILYKLWLNILCGHNPKTINKAVEKFGSAEEIFKSDEAYKTLLSGFRLRRVLTARRSLNQAEELLRYCEENGIEILSIGDKGYPNRLAEIYCPPQILYVKGDLPDIDSLVCVTIVGSRECSDYSRRFANELAYDLTKSGVVVISGMALGIDAAAHTGALDAGGVTVAALAGGVDVIYPKAHRKLYGDIVENGAVISERPPGTVGRGGYYNERNRLLVGMSNGVIIAAGSSGSGTSITAKWALSEGRDLYAVPGKPGDEGAELPNSLIKDSAKLTTSAEDVVEDYVSVYSVELENGIKLLGDRTDSRRKARRISEWGDARLSQYDTPKKPAVDIEKFEGKQRIILEYLLNNNEAVHIDEISRGCGISAAELNFEIIQLLMQRVIKEHPGEYYSLD